MLRFGPLPFAALRVRVTPSFGFAGLVWPGGLGQRRAAESAGDVSGGAAACRAVESDSSTLGVFGTGAFRHSIDFPRATRGTDQWFLIPIRRDQNQRFRCPVFFNTPTSHGRPFQRGMWHGSGYPLKHGIYRLFSGRAKASPPSRHVSESYNAQALAGVIMVAGFG